MPDKKKATGFGALSEKEMAILKKVKKKKKKSTSGASGFGAVSEAEMKLLKKMSPAQFIKKRNAAEARVKKLRKRAGY